MANGGLSGNVGSRGKKCRKCNVGSQVRKIGSQQLRELELNEEGKSAAQWLLDRTKEWREDRKVRPAIHQEQKKES